MDSINKHAVLYAPAYRGYFIFTVGEDPMDINLGLSKASSLKTYGIFFLSSSNSHIYYDSKEELSESMAIFKKSFPDYKVRVGFKESTVKKLTHANRSLRELFFEMFKNKKNR